MALWGRSSLNELQSRIEDIQAGLSRPRGDLLGGGPSAAGEEATRGARAARKSAGEAADELTSALTPVASDLRHQIEALASIVSAATGAFAKKAGRERQAGLSGGRGEGRGQRDASGRRRRRRRLPARRHAGRRGEPRRRLKPRINPGTVAHRHGAAPPETKSPASLRGFLLVRPVSRSFFAAATMLTSAGRTSSHLRVFRPQSGLTQIWSGASRCLRLVEEIAHLARVGGTRGEWMS